MQLGPAGSSLSAVAGADIRDEIYSWPTINPCRIDAVLHLWPRSFSAALDCPTKP